MTITEKKAVVREFLARCNVYAEEKLAGYRSQLAGASPWQAMQIEDKINHWSAYRAFNVFTIEELETAELDEWFR